MIGYLHGIYRAVLGQSTEKEPEISDEGPIEYVITKTQLEAFTAAIDAKLEVMKSQIARIEGTHGYRIKQLNEEREELIAENEELRAVVDEKISIETQRAQMEACMPEALNQLPISDEQRAQAKAFFTDPNNQRYIDESIQKFFPGVPVTTQSLVQLAPTIYKFVQGLVAKAQENQKPRDENEQEQGNIF